MATWRALEDYSPLGRLLVEYMWEQRPPLLPSQFAQRMGVRKQQVAVWLSADSVPPPAVLMRLARGMGIPIRTIFAAAGYASEEDPLFDRVGAWDYVLDQIEQSVAAAQFPRETRDLVIKHVQRLRDSDAANGGNVSAFSEATSNDPIAHIVLSAVEAVPEEPA
jgi:transcriptional regulator with XRE-family HTH domain